MKLIIQVPCFNEEKTLPVTLAGLPRAVAGFDRVEWLIIDDGSADETVQAAKAHNVDHIIRFTKHQGLTRAFLAGIDACLKLGADVIVNTDADNQYNAADIIKLTGPVLEKKADMVIGTRPMKEIRHFSMAKKFLQKLGSRVVGLVSGLHVPDATSGFRAISREAAMKFNVFNDYTYTLETIIQAGRKGMAVASVPVRVNEYLRPSRLYKSVVSYLWRSLATIVRIVVVYKPFKFFMTVGSSLFGLGLLFGARFLFFLAQGRGAGHVQSLILTSILLGIGFQTLLIAFIADLLAVNRALIEDLQYRVRKIEIESHQGRGPGGGEGGA